MLKNQKTARALRAVCFLLLAAVMLLVLNFVLSPTKAGFYREEPDTVDVLFLGTSLTYCSAVPAVLWEEYGITSYNLSYPQQSMAATYYYLREFLKEQSPRVVVLEPEAFTFPDEYARSPENIAEMRFGTNMIEAVQADVGTNVVDYLVPFMRYHTTYSQLNEAAFTKTGPSSARRIEERGYMLLTPEGGRSANAEVSFELGEDRGGDFPAAKSVEYMDLILQLCEENGAQLYLYKAAWLDYPADCMQAIQTWADEAGVPLRDYNQLAGELGLESRDMLDDGNHMSVYGAHKLTRDLGAVLQQEYDLPDRRTDGTFNAQSWDEMAHLHSRRIKTLTIRGEKDDVAYINLLNDEDYVVFISVSGDGGRIVDSPRQLALETMGIQIPLRYQDEEGYAAVMDGGQLVFEQMGENVYQVGNASGAAYRVESDYQTGMCSIQVDKEECSLGVRGVNIVVYDKVLRQVVDKSALSFATEGGLVR